MQGSLPEPEHRNTMPGMRKNIPDGMPTRSRMEYRITWREHPAGPGKRTTNRSSPTRSMMLNEKRNFTGCLQNPLMIRSGSGDGQNGI